MLLFRKEYNKYKAVGEGVPTIYQGSVRVVNEKDILDAAVRSCKDFRVCERGLPAHACAEDYIASRNHR